MIRHYRTIYSYIIKEILISFIVAFAFFFFIFFVNQILLIAEKILAKKVPLLQVMQLMVYFLPQIVSIAFPFAALVGALMAVGRLSADNEILAFRSSGISLIRLFMPMFFISILFTIVAFIFNDYLLPLGYLKSKDFYNQIIKTNPGIEFEPYMAKKIEEKTIITGDIKDNILQDIVIIDKTSDQEKRIISAAHAALVDNQNQTGVISLELEDVFIHTSDSVKKGEYEYTYAEKMIYNILIKDIFEGTIESKPTAREMDSIEVWKVITERNSALEVKKQNKRELIAKKSYELQMELLYANDLSEKQRRNKFPERMGNIQATFDNLEKEKKEKITDKTLRIYLLEFYRKFSHPFACVVFIVFAFPAGLVARRSGKLVGFAIGVIMSGVYWGMLFASYKLGVNPEYSAFMSIWTPNFIILGLGILGFILRIKR